MKVKRQTKLTDVVPQHQIKSTKANIAKHVILYTVSLNNPHFINRTFPQSNTFLDSLALSNFNPEHPLFNSLRFNWKVYFVVAYKDKFNKFDKNVIIQSPYDFVNRTWTQALKMGMIDLQKELVKVDSRWRMNIGVIFDTNSKALTVDQIESYLDKDPMFNKYDPDREIDSTIEAYDNLAPQIAALEKLLEN